MGVQGSNNDDDERYATTMKNSNELSDIIKTEFKKLRTITRMRYLYLSIEKGKSLKNINVFNLYSLFCPKIEADPEKLIEKYLSLQGGTKGN